jgi:predicted nucleic acid-binding protein
MVESVLLDTSFLIRLLNDEDPLHDSAKKYFKYFLDSDVSLKVSTISIAEYCVRGSVEELPLKNLHLVPFNYNHGIKAGEFAKIIFEDKSDAPEKFYPRAIIPNDSKLFAQADVESDVKYFVTSDSRSKNIYRILVGNLDVNFEIADINRPYNELFGVLDF